MRMRRVVVTTAVTTLALAPAAASAAPASTETVRQPVVFSQASLGVCDGMPGTLSVDGVLVRHVTLTGSTYNERGHLHGEVSFVPDDPDAPAASGRFVEHTLFTLNFGQLKDARQRQLTRSVVATDDGDRFPVAITTVTHFGADGSVEVLVDEVRCGT